MEAPYFQLLRTGVCKVFPKCRIAMDDEIISAVTDMPEERNVGVIIDD